MATRKSHRAGPGRDPAASYQPETLAARLFRETAAREEVALATVARSLGASTGAVEQSVRALQKTGLIEVRGGRQRFRLNPAFGHIVGIDMGASNLRYVLADFRGKVLKESNQKIRPEDGPAKVISQIQQGIRALGVAPGFSPAPVAPSPHSGQTPKDGATRWLRAIAIGVPSPVDPRTGLVALANLLPGWKGVDLRSALEKVFRVPVSLENDANMAAIGEHWRGVARGVRNFVFVALGTGIGSGVFTEGRLYRGRTGSAGELFRLNLEWTRWNEEFPDTGYLESEVSGFGIAAAGRRVLGPPPGETGGMAAERDAHFVFEAMRKGNPLARAVVEKAFIMMGVAAADVVAVLDPDLIVFGGGLTKGDPKFLIEKVTEVVKRIHPDPPLIKLSALEDRAQIYGAIRLALELAYDAAAKSLGHSGFSPRLSGNRL